VAEALSLPSAELVERAEQIVEALRCGGVEAHAVASTAAVGGGGAPGVELPSAAVSLPAELAAALRTGEVSVMGRVERDRCLLDLRSVAPEQDELLVRAVLAAARPGDDGA
jgi:L-seryl-tRNA(Ser) seleniumtransferase